MNLQIQLSYHHKGSLLFFFEYSNTSLYLQMSRPIFLKLLKNILKISKNILVTRLSLAFAIPFYTGLKSILFNIFLNILILYYKNGYFVIDITNIT